MSIFLRTTLLLIASNVFMTFAWHAHLKNLNDRKWCIAAFASWGIALFEYLLQVRRTASATPSSVSPRSKLCRKSSPSRSLRRSP